MEILQPEVDLDNYSARAKYTSNFSWAIPNDRAIAKYSPILDIGAGSGYWASLVAASGGDIIATDPRIHYEFSQYHCEVLEMDDKQAMEAYPDRNVLLVWPPMSKMAYDVARRMKLNQTLIYIGEDNYGCNANEEFFDILDAEFELVNSISLTQWYGIHDRLDVYKKVQE